LLFGVFQSPLRLLALFLKHSYPSGSFSGMH
jgi:hypothetical protein